MEDETLRNLAEDLAAIDETLSVKFGRADGFGLVDASIVDLKRQSTVRVWNEGRGDFWFQFGDEQQAAWWKQDGKCTLPKVILALLDGAYAVQKGRVTLTVDGQSVVLRDAI